MAAAAANAGIKVCVTGATSFIGAHVVRILLERGYSVVGTCRTEAKAAFIKALPGAEERLTVLAGVDLLTPGAFDAAVEGCTYVHHIASPFYLDAKTAEELIGPAEQGTSNVYSACLKAGATLRRVVSTSSFAAIMFGPSGANKDHRQPYTEESWNTFSTVESGDPYHWYRVSKVRAERVAWRLMATGTADAPSAGEDADQWVPRAEWGEQRPPFDVVTVNPPLVIGANIPGQPSLNTSSKRFRDLCAGKDKSTGIPRGGMPFVAVEDVALCHVNAMEAGDKAAGRYIACGGSATWKDIVAWVREDFPEFAGNLPAVDAPLPEGAAEPVVPQMVNAKATRDLGVDFMSVRESIRNQIGALKAGGWLDDAVAAPAAGDA